jgi:hypothetical protein
MDRGRPIASAIVHRVSCDPGPLAMLLYGAIDPAYCCPGPEGQCCCGQKPSTACPRDRLRPPKEDFLLRLARHGVT